MANKLVRNRESISGFHFFELFLKCPRKFSIKYLARVIPNFTTTALISGYAFHDGKATFYTTKSKKRAINTVESIINARRDEFKDYEQFEHSMERTPYLLRKWIEHYGLSDFKDYKIIDVEKYIEMPIKGSPFKVTMRLDGVVQDRDDGYLWLMETKTSSSSINITKDGLMTGDQITTYLLGMQKAYPKHTIAGAIGDIAYLHKNAKHFDNNVQFVREEIFRTKKDLKEYELSTATILNELNAKVKAFQTGKYHPLSLFPRSTFYCNAFFKRCEYASICRDNIPMKGRLPHGFKRDRNSKKRIITTVTEV